MAGPVPVLMKDLVLLAMSFYLLKQDLIRLGLPSMDSETVASRPRVKEVSAAVQIACQERRS
jgi:hypothetical protein